MSTTLSFVRRKRGQVLLVHSERVLGTARVRQRQLHRFASPAELADTLTPAGWKRWTSAMVWRESEIEFDWSEIRRRLTEELATWEQVPNGAKRRRDEKLVRLASELATELGRVSLAKPEDAAVVERLRPSLAVLRESIDRLSPSVGAVPTRSNRDVEMLQIHQTINQAAEDAFDEGMEYWWVGDRRRAAKHFRAALKLDPLHADANNHLGIISLESRRLKAAKTHFRTAVDGGERYLEQDGAEIPWGIIGNRPYLRALANLALVYLEQREWADALGVHEQLLKVNPSDNQGVRYLIGAEYLRVGDYDAAIDAFQQCVHEEVGCAFGLALAKLIAQGPSADIGEELLIGFAANRYVAPMLLGDNWERLDAFYSTNMAEPEWAQDVVDAQAELWQAVPRGAQLLRFWWASPPVARWRQELDETRLRLKDLPPSRERSQLLSEWQALSSEQTLQRLVAETRSLS